jgi:GNAT superfamily N-acetyltransferase
MKLKLRRVESLEEALALAPRLDQVAAQFLEQFSDETYPSGACERFLRRHFLARECALVLAEDGERAWGACLSGPFVEPLLGTSRPMILVLFVEPELRHRGVATELVKETEALFAARGIRGLLARVPHNDDALISMGERSGFVRSWELMEKE